MDLQDPVNISFTSVAKENESYSFKIQQFFFGTLYGNITGKVKDNIEPLSSLFLSLNALYKSPDERSLSSATYESHPVVYGVFPYVNLVRNQTGSKCSFIFLFESYFVHTNLLYIFSHYATIYNLKSK